MPADLDQGGNLSQIVRVYRGPTLGWEMVYVKPPRNVVAAGAVTLSPGDSMVFVNVAGLVTINLPLVSAWLRENYDSPHNAFEGAIWIKDLGGHAAAFNITVTPFGADTIDGQAISYTIVQNHQLLRLYPLTDLTGWFSG